MITAKRARRIAAKSRKKEEIRQISRVNKSIKEAIKNGNPQTVFRYLDNVTIKSLRDHGFMVERVEDKWDVKYYVRWETIIIDESNGN